MNRPLAYCAQPGCSVLVPRGRCRTHAVQQEHTRRNWEVRTWYRRPAWKHLRLQVLVDQAHACAQCGRVTVQLEVDHIVKHDGSPRLFWDRGNLQALCPPCHGRKTRQGA
jgi:5-methylcytosine-specific restriction enzyme A